MGNKQKTFSVAVSRQMAPVSRLVAYVHVDGQFLADSLVFFVRDPTLTQVNCNHNNLISCHF